MPISRLRRSSAHAIIGVAGDPVPEQLLGQLDLRALAERLLKTLLLNEIQHLHLGLIADLRPLIAGGSNGLAYLLQIAKWRLAPESSTTVTPQAPVSSPAAKPDAFFCFAVTV